MMACRCRVKVLIVALIISVLLYFRPRVTSLKSEADGAWFLADDAVRERDRMKLNVSGLNIKGLGAFPGDDVSFPLGLEGVINVNL